VSLGLVPEILDAVDVVMAVHEEFGMVDPEVPTKAEERVFTKPPDRFCAVFCPDLYLPPLQILVAVNACCSARVIIGGG